MQRGMMTVAVWLLLFLIGGSPLSGAELNPLPSWNDGASKKSIVDFVERVTREGGADYVKPEERIATFDHDGIPTWVDAGVPVWAHVYDIRQYLYNKLWFLCCCYRTAN